MKLPSMTTVTGMEERAGVRLRSPAVSGRLSAFGSTVMEPLVSMMAYSASAGLK